MIKQISLVLLIGFLAGCSSFGVFNPATGRKELIVISTPQEIKMGADIHRDLLRQNKLVEDKRKLERLWRIGQEVAQVSDRQDYSYHFFLIDQKDINAFTTPGGNIYFYLGLFDQLTTDDQIAAVLAHEIGHCAAKHTVKKFQAALGYNFIGSLVFDRLAMDQSYKQITSIGTNLAMNVIFSAYSRQDEFQADQLGIKYLYLAGYDLNGMIETLSFLEKESKGDHVPLMMRSHPYVTDRIKAALKEIETVKSKYSGEQ